MRLEIQDRGYHTLDIFLNGKTTTFKIPKELNVSEVERLLEAQIKIDKILTEQVIDGGSAQLRLYWGLIFSQLEIIFRHYQPEIEAEYLKEHLPPQDAIKILGFFSENRYVEKEAGDVKKKLN